MFAKYGLLILALGAAWFVLLRPALAAARRQPKPKGPPDPPAADLAPCPECGVYRMPGGPCNGTSSPARHD